MNQTIQIMRDNSPLIIALLTLTSTVFAALFGKSEKLALDPSTKANGIIQGNRLAKAALAVVPVVSADMSKGADLAATIGDVAAAISAEDGAADEPALAVAAQLVVEAPVAASPDLAAIIAAKQAELAALQAQAATA